MAEQKPSPVLEKNLQKRIAELQSQIQSLEISARTAQDAWDAQRSQIVSETETRVQQARDEVSEVIAKTKAQIVDSRLRADEDNIYFLQQKTEQEQQYTKLQADLVELNRTIEVHSLKNNHLQDQNRTLLSEIEVSQRNANNLKEQEHLIQTSLTEAKSQQNDLTNNLKVIHEQFAVKEAEFADLERTYYTKLAKKTEELSLVESKLLTHVQTMKQDRAEIEEARNELATRQRVLDARDQNLRIREQKVEIGENKLLQNSSLLDL